MKPYRPKLKDKLISSFIPNKHDCFAGWVLKVWKIILLMVLVGMLVNRLIHVF